MFGKISSYVMLPVLLLCSVGSRSVAQSDSSRLRVSVVLVQLNVAVTDRKGNYVTGLHPEDFELVEDKIPQRLSTFEEGNEGPRRVLPPGYKDTSGVEVKVDSTVDPVSGELVAVQPKAPTSPYAGANVFILFDTSNYMYKQFVFAQDAIGDFVRSLEGVGKVALYSYSRNLSRITPLTTDRSLILRGVRSTVAGDDEALYNSLLMTVKDTAHLTGRKAIVVFSNGPDNASLVPPEDVAELAQSTGTIIYMISTQEAQKEPISSAVFERVSKATGGKAYFSRNWRDQKEAFDSIRQDLAHLYTLSYYPQANPNRGWRAITVKLAGKDLQKYRVRTRVGYRLLNAAQ
jgi:Ca-activated chloride channel family protein